MGHDGKRWMLRVGMGIVLCLWLGAGAVGAQAVQGVVFFDDNADGAIDEGESGVEGVAVSDGTQVVRTDGSGRFSLELAEEARFVFISAPTGGRTARWYLRADGATAYNFPLERTDVQGALVFVQLSDIHYAPTPEEFKLGLRDRRMQILPNPVLDGIRDEVNALGPDFVFVAGDIVADSKYPEPEMVDRWMGAMLGEYLDRFSAPVYSAVGNHDVVRDESIDKTIYEAYAGPTYYSFNVKGTHCVVLDTQQLVGTGLVYSVDARQLAWLEQDLATVDPGAPILVFCHQPTYDWDDTPESEQLFGLLQRTGITALLNGHWHTNSVLREQPFYELTSGAVCGAWWEGPGPDGSGFGYRVFRFAHGNLDSIWIEAGEERVGVPSPSRAVLTWVDRLHANVWGRAERASYRWDGAPPIEVDAHWNGLWSSIFGNLNVSTLADGYHTLSLEFSMTDGHVLREARTFYVSNPAIALQEIIDHEDTYRGKIVAAPSLQVRAVMGTDISAFDDTKTIIISGFPYPVSRNDRIAIVGMYRPTSTAPISIYDPAFCLLLGEKDDD